MFRPITTSCFFIHFGKYIGFKIETSEKIVAADTIASNDNASENSNENPKKEKTKTSLIKPSIFATVEEKISVLVGLFMS